MNLGCCTRPLNCAAMRRIGFDFIELAACDVAKMSCQELRNAADILMRYQIPCLGFNSYSDGDPALTGPSFEPSAAREYAKLVCERASFLGASNIGIGAPKARLLPAGYDYSLANSQMKESLSIICEEANPHSITVLYEALNSKICDFGLSTDEALKTVKELNLPNLALVLDFYHMLMMNEDTEDIARFMPYVRHLHLSHRGSGISREYLKPEGMDFYRRSIGAAMALDYNGTLSIEATPYSFDDDALGSYNILKDILTGR